MWGLFGGGYNSQNQQGGNPLQGALHTNSGQMRPQPQPKQKQSKAPSKWNSRMDIIGGILRDLDPMSSGGSQNAAVARQQSIQEQYRQRQEMARKQALLQQATQGMTPQAAAAYQMNPNAGSAAQIGNAIPNNLQVDAGNRAQRALELQAQGQQFNQGMATDKFAHQVNQDEFGNNLATDKFEYTQGRDQTDDDFRLKQFDRNAMESDRGFGLQSRQLGHRQNIDYANLDMKQKDVDSRGDFSPAEISKHRARADQLTKVGGTIKNYYDLLSTTGKRAIPVGEKVAQLQAAYGAALMDAKELFELGALSGPDLDLVYKTIPKPTGILHNDEKALSKLRETYRYVGRSSQVIPEEYRPEIPELDGSIFGGQEKETSANTELSAIEEAMKARGMSVNF